MQGKYFERKKIAIIRGKLSYVANMKRPDGWFDAEFIIIHTTVFATFIPTTTIKNDWRDNEDLDSGM